MNSPIINHIAIIGSDLAAWMCAAALSKRLDRKQLKITVVDSDPLGHMFTGEASLPMLADFHRMLGIDEHTFAQETLSTEKLGTEFIGWNKPGESFIHSMDAISTAPCNTLTDSNILQPRAPLVDGPTSTPEGHAFHIDVKRYAEFLKQFALRQGVNCVEGRVNTIQRNRNTGDIKNVILTNGQSIYAGFFVDCTGTRSRILGHTLRTPFIDWAHWLPCDRLISLSSEPLTPYQPYTQIQAMTAGWSWHIPLHNRSDLGYIYSSNHLSDDAAHDALTAWLDRPTVSGARHLKFKNGRRQASWVNNCVALGPASGFLEPMESTNLYLIQTAIISLLENFPQAHGNSSRQEIFNGQISAAYEHVRDFLVLHYRLSNPFNSDFWQHSQDMPLPDSLGHQLTEFQTSGQLRYPNPGIFGLSSWQTVCAGHGFKHRANNCSRPAARASE